MTAGQTISSDSRIVELLELLTNSQMNTHTEQVKQMCEYVETMEQQLSFMTEEIKNVRQKLESMKEETLSKRVKYGLQKTADTLHKQCDSLKQQVSCGLLVTGGICHHDQRKRTSHFKSSYGRKRECQMI